MLPRLVIAVLVALSLLPFPASAHTAGGQAYVYINGQATLANPLSAIDSTFAQDVAPKNYVVNTPLEFKVDKQALGELAEFRWRWFKGDPDPVPGDIATHVYAQPGTYLITLEIKYSGDRDFGQADTLSINILPKAGYKLPTAKINVTSRALDDGFQVSFDAQESHDPSTQIKSYGWRFDDSGMAQGKTVKHNYQGRSFTATPYLRLTDKNNLSADAAYNLRATGDKVTAEPLAGPAIPGAGPPSRPAGALTLAVAAVSFIAIVVLMFFQIRRIRRSR
jgi:hypothetical protein